MNLYCFSHWTCPLLLGLVVATADCAAQSVKTFATPQEAVTALDQAVNTTNRTAFAELFGADATWMANPDSVQGARELADFTAAFNATNRLVRESDSRQTI